LDNGVPILVYSGDQDFICNWFGGLAWTKALEWTGYAGYNDAPIIDWTTEKSGELYGQSKSFGPLTFLRIFGAGHMVPMD
jgi:cathepsin A (carboxypeptidase C)